VNRRPFGPGPRLHWNEKGLTNIGASSNPGFSSASGCPMTVPSLAPDGQTNLQAASRSCFHFEGALQDEKTSIARLARCGIWFRGCTTTSLILDPGHRPRC
jgi:hypothetical protein